MKLEQKIKDMAVKKKMTFYGVIMVAVVILLGVISGAASILMNMQTEAITECWMPSLTYAKELDTLTSDYRIKQYAHLTAATEEEMIRYEAEIKELENQIAETSTKMETYLVNEEEFVMLADIREKWAQYKEASAEIIVMSRNGETKEASAHMVGDIKDIYDDFGLTFDEFVDYEQEHADISAGKAETLFVLVLAAIGLFIIFSIVVVVRISKIMTKLITEPLEKVQNAMRKLYKEGDLNFTLEYDAKDEFGHLVKEINTFVTSLVTIIKDEARLMAEMAKGNFNVNSEVRELYIGDFEQILLSMRGIKIKLGTALSGITDSVVQVDTAAGQMAAEAQSLAEGATQQASAVEEIVATIESVQNESVISTEEAVKASKYAKEAKEKTENSNQQMHAMVDEMNRITDTSKEISSIIGAIEDIASQTNLLSLNASIEAARAGEAGRGFAVVADEIGKLALQCSKSANTTRELIETAISQTEKGNAIATSTADALYEVSEKVIQITEIADQVKENCEHQTLVLQEVDRAMEEISGIVETNSASAEESSAASEELAAHAESLKALLADFQFSKEVK